LSFRYLVVRSSAATALARGGFVGHGAGAVKTRRATLSFIFVTLFLDIFGIGLIIPILPKLVESLQGGDVSAASRTVGALAALYSLMQFLCAPVLGSLSDHYGRRPIILASLFGSFLDYVLLFWAPNLGWFYLGRIIAGVTSANITAASAYIADVSPPEKRAANFGIIGAAFGLGFIAGPALGGLLGTFGLRVPFIVAAGLTLLNWCYGLFVLPESLAPENRRKFSWRRANPAGSLLALRHFPVVLGLTGTFFLINVAQNFIHSTWVLYMSYRYGWSSREVGLSLAIVGVMAAIIQGGLARRIIPALGERRAIVLGLGLGVLNMTGYGLATHGWMIYAILVVGAIGSIGGPALQGLISRNVPPDQQGAVSGALSSVASLAGILGPPIGAGLFGWGIRPAAPIHLPGLAFFAGAALIAGALALAVRSFRRTAAALPASAPPGPPTTSAAAD
jgi:MFS transporter, DHA1 family, tetracycline resistance protein